ncbi:MAG: hypothetical protein Q4D32_02385 [Eubacteriales bacterium]|nr:hypothetical protein [Eubacteriales bacterium]
MKKLLKFIVAVAAAAGVVLGALYVLREYFGLGEDSEEKEESDFDEVFADEMDDREYVTLDIDGEEDEETEDEED